MNARQAMLTIDFNNVSLEDNLERLALEANVLSNVIETFRNVVPGLTDKIKSFLSGFNFKSNTTSIDYSKLMSNQKNITKYVKLGMADDQAFSLDLLILPKPFGLVSSYIDCIEFLFHIVPKVHKLVNETLVEYNFMLSSFITNAEDKISNHDQSAFIKKVSNSREDLIKQFDNYFDPNGSERGKYKDLVGKVNNINEIVKLVQKLDQVFHQHSNKLILDSVNNCVALLDIVAKNSEKEITVISGTSAMNISNGAMEVAKLVEFVSVMSYRAEATISTIQQAMEIIEKRLEGK